jgi:hypothetical protein
MPAPAIPALITKIVEKVEAIAPTEGPGSRFRRSGEAAPATTRNRRTFDLDFTGQPADLSLTAGTQTVGVADVLASFRLDVEYPLARNERNLETVLASDSEHIRRALTRSANWTGTTVRACRSFRSTVEQEVAPDGTPGTVHLLVDVTYLYREQE